MSNPALGKELAEKTRVKVKWHGDAATRVLVKGDAEKTEVKPGGVIEVEKEQAAELLKYSHLFTLEDQKPVDHAFDKEQARLRDLSKKKAAKAAGKGGKTENKAEEKKEADGEVLTREQVAAMKKKADVAAALEGMGVTFNKDAKLDELKALLSEKLEPVWKDMEASEGSEDEKEEGDESEEGDEDDLEDDEEEGDAEEDKE